MPGKAMGAAAALASTHALVAARRARLPARLRPRGAHRRASAAADRAPPARRGALRLVGPDAAGAAGRAAARDLPRLLRPLPCRGRRDRPGPRGGGRRGALRRGGVGARRPARRMAAGAHLILGAGLGSLALADALLDEGVSGPVVLVDRRTSWPRDRTWCFWDVDVPYAGLATHRWDEWEVVTEHGTATHHSARHPYLRLPADAFYGHVLGRLKRDPRVELRTGVSIASVEEARTLAPGATVHDARGPAAPPAGALAQRFLGLEVRTETPRFTPGRATLMDFRVGQDGGLHFVYVLPFSAHEALVEDTWFAVEPVAEARHRAEIATWIDAPFEVLHEERGVLPMTPVAAGPAAVGGLRASSGYAFARTVRHARALARAAAGGDPRPRAGSARWDRLDAVFLRALDADPEAFPERFRRLVARTPAGAFARFMTDASTIVDEAAIVAALPKVPFARAALARS